MDNSEPEEVLYESRFLRLLRKGHWDYAQRIGAKGAVIIIPVTDAGQLIFVEQFRVPVNRRVIEFPAGIVGDEAAYAEESLADAARRELVEETGYEAATLRDVFTGASSAGMSDELSTFFIALGLKKISEGGGVDHERILIHAVPLSGVWEWLQQQQLRENKILDARIYSGLYLLERFAQEKLPQ